MGDNLDHIWKNHNYSQPSDNPLFESGVPPVNSDEEGKPMSFQQFALNGVEVLFDHNVHENSLEGALSN